MKTVIILFALLVASSCRYYINFNQCDNRWKNDHVGNKTLTICQVGCVISSIASSLRALGYSHYTPQTVNQ